MTVIVVKDKVIATDSGLWQDESLIADDVTKIIRCKFGVFAVCGHVGALAVVKNLFDEAEEIPTSLDLGKDSMVVLLTNAGELMIHDDGAWDTYPLPFYACGSAGPVALGALHMGADAVTACQIAIKVGPWAAGEVQSLAVGGVEDERVAMDAIIEGLISPEETYDPADETPLWRRQRGL